MLNVQEGTSWYQFCIFFKRHCHLPANKALLHKDIAGNNIFRGDAMIMRVGTRRQYVNMQGRDIILSDWVIGR
jgi:hypothetical protein